MKRTKLAIAAMTLAFGVSTANATISPSSLFTFFAADGPSYMSQAYSWAMTCLGGIAIDDYNGPGVYSGTCFSG